MVGRELETYFRKKVSDEISKTVKEWNENVWKQEGEKFVREFIEKNAPAALAGLANVMIRDAMNSLYNNNTGLNRTY